MKELKMRAQKEQDKPTRPNNNRKYFPKPSAKP